MAFNKLTIKDVDITKKRVLIRVDFNAPLDNEGNITDVRKIAAYLPTINYAMSQKAKIILMSHLGRPKGKVVPELSLQRIAIKLGELLKTEVSFVGDCIGENVQKLVMAMNPCEVMLLENLRFYQEEEANDPNFAKELASSGEVYVDDAFGAVHRAHASVSAITKYFDKAVAGFLMEKEMEYLDRVLTNPPKPFVIAIGGSKVSTKMGIVEHLIKKADLFLIGGGMSYTFQKALGKTIGSSLVGENYVPIIKKLLEENMGKIVLPLDYKITDMFSKTEYGNVQTTVDENIPDGWMGLDIGPKTIEKFIMKLDGAGCILWNGPFGVIEIPEFAVGTTKMAYAISDSAAVTIAGGGETAESINSLEIAHKFNHISTGGGACLEFLEGRELPGLAVLTDKGINTDC
ncbi:MAG: phosphoglycerate kinase [bacterium]|nr:phosphoglycerate kinase [bacterium]